MTNIRAFLVLALTMTMMAPAAWAQRRGGGESGGGERGSGFYLGFHLLPENASSKVEPGSSGLSATESKANSMTLEALLGYNFGAVYFGVIYHSISSSIASVENKASAAGVSIGTFLGGFVLMGHYFVQARRDASGTASWGEGSGYGADLGYLFPVTGNFAMGANLAYRSFTYKKYDTGMLAFSDATYTATSLSPRLTFGFIF